MSATGSTASAPPRGGVNRRVLAVGLGFVVPLLFVLLMNLGRDPHAVRSPLVGRPAPPFALTPVGGGAPVTLESLRGRLVVLNFWATWCAPCIKEMPLLDAFYKEHQAKGWHVVGLAIDSPTPVREFLGKLPVSFPIGLAGLTGVDLARSLGNASGALPFSLAFDRRGAVIFRKLGLLKPEDLREWAQKFTQAQ
jgi:thiol-disulfide isomerase/thioredoxin